jgi:Gpi18-like mannosyltransferase
MKFNKRAIYILIFLGFFIRFFLLPFPGHEHDMAFWKAWSLYGADFGPIKLIENLPYYNYPSFFAVFISVFGVIFKLIQSPYNVVRYWQTTNLTYLFSFKIWSISGDVIVAWLIYTFGSKLTGKKIGLILSLFFFLSPISLIDGAFWGQVDGLGVAFFLLALWLAWRQKPAIASAVLVVGIFFKLQNIVFAPLFYLYLALTLDLKSFAKCLGWSLATLLLVNLPFILAKKTELIFATFNRNLDYYPYFTLKANNLWAIIAKDGYWDRWPDQQLLWGLTSAKNFGMAAFVVLYLIACLNLLFSGKEARFKNFVLSCLLSVLSFFTILTQMHDRYLYPLFPLLLVYFALETTWQKKFKIFAMFYVVCSLFYFGNLYSSFAFQYQYLGLTRLDNFLNGRLFVLANSIIICLGLLGMLGLLLKKLPKILRLTPLLLPLMLLGQNWGFLNNKPISASKFLATNWKQSYGQPQKNMSVNSFLGPQYWTRLSNNYYYYERGIGSHAFSEIYFWINGQFSRLETDYGLDTEAGDQAKVIFEIEADNKILFTSIKMGKTDLPKHLNLEIKGVKKLTLRIKDTETGINGAHADWLNPVFYR